MTWYYTLYAFAPLLAALISLMVFFLVWPRRHSPLGRVFLLMLASTAFWSACAAAEISNASLTGKLILVRLQYVAIISLPFIWLAFALIYSGRERWLSRRVLLPLAAIEAVAAAGLLTNQWHHLFWRPAHLGYDGDAGLYFLAVGHGPLWYLHAAVSYALVLFGSLLIFGSLLRARAIYRYQALALLTGAMLPWVASILFVTGLSPLPHVDPTPIAFAFSGVAFAIGIARFQMINVVPAARDAVIESMGDAVFVLDDERRIIDVNPAALALVRRPSAWMIGRTMGDLLPDHEQLIARLRHMETATTEIVVDRGRGLEHYDVRISSLKDSRGRITGRLIVARDISAQKHFEAELRRAKEAAEEASRAKSSFLANMSHELRTPLNAVIGYSELAADELAGTERADLVPDLERITSAGRHLLTLINDVLDLAKIEAGRIELRMELVDPVPLLRELVATVEPMVQEQGNSLVLYFEGDPGVLWSDPLRLRQVLLNLLANAAKFTEHGLITLHVVRDAGAAPDHRPTVIFEVRDTGIGISEEQMGRLFQPFTQADSSTTRRHGGTGLGLAISKHFCQLMGGEISVASELGRGTTVTVRLPTEPLGDQLASDPSYMPSADAATSQ